MNKNQHSYSQKKTKQYQRMNDGAWEKICSLSIGVLDKILTVTDKEWIDLFCTIVQYNDVYKKCFTFTRDARGMHQVQVSEQFISNRTDMLQYIRIREFPRDNVSIHFSQQFLFGFSGMKQVFMNRTNNGFLMERPQLNSDSPYNNRFYKNMRSFTFDIWIIQMIECKIWQHIMKPQAYHKIEDPVVDQQERTLLDFWQSYLNHSLYSKILEDFFRQAKCTELFNYTKTMFDNNKWQLQCIYDVVVLLYFNPQFMQVMRQLLGYLERLRKVMYGFRIVPTNTTAYPFVHSTEIYKHVLDGAMELSRESIPQLGITRRGINLTDTSNNKIIKQLGKDLMLFTEWCESRCSWRRRGYLVVVNELTRIIHKTFEHAQIELYGSSRTGLMIPSSDVDMVLVDNTSLLDKIAALLNDIPWIREVKHIRGSMHVVKVYIDHTVMTNTTMIPTMENDVLVVDITQISTTHTGISTAYMIKNRLNRFWELTPLILFMKELLYANRLNSAYEGGMNSVAAVIVVMAFFHDWQQTSDYQADIEYNNTYDSKNRELGTLILHLLYQLGFKFNYLTTGINAELGFFGREEIIKEKPEVSLFETDPIVVLDPMNPLNNLGKSCFNVYNIKALFRNTYRQLIDNIDNNCEHPLLEILGVTEQCQSFQEHYF